MYGKLDIKPSETTNITIGGNVYTVIGMPTYRTFQMFDYENNPKVYDQDIRGYAKFTQRFPANHRRKGKMDIYSAMLLHTADRLSKDIATST